MTGYAIGLMSGTSVDGIDAALVQLTEREGSPFPLIRVVDCLYVPYSNPQREAIFSLFDPNATIARLGIMHVTMGEWFAAAVAELMNKSGISPADVSVIGSHGQTILHYPGGLFLEDGRRSPGFSLQIGDASVIAENTQIDVVSDFRSRDIAAGGEGAPLVPYFDYAVFSSPYEDRVLLNIGGISNVTCLPAGLPPESTIAFDTGPGNMILDGAMEIITSGRAHFDTDGQLAAGGTIIEPLLDKWLTHPYLQGLPPKSTGRETFGVLYTEQLVKEARGVGACDADVLSTLTAFVARTIADAILSFMPSGFSLMAAGGGCKNTTLMNHLTEYLGLSKPVLSTEAFGIPPDFKEAVAFAYLAWQFTQGRTSNLAKATGARGPRRLGRWSPGR